MNKRKSKKHFKKVFPLGWGVMNLMKIVNSVCLDITKQDLLKKETTK